MKGREIVWRCPAALMLAAAALALACGEERPVTSPEESTPAGALPGHNLAVSVTCTADVRGPSLSCSGPNTAGILDGPRFLIVGGQNVFVQLANTEPQLQGRRFRFDVTVKNLLPQALGTPDGTTNTGVKVFFHTPPTATSGTGELTITVDNEAGSETFTNTNQPYYEYGQIIDPDETSAPEPWQFTLGSGVVTFEFQVYVAADVPFPNGFVQVTPSPDSAFLGGTNALLTASVVDALGREVSGRTVTWGSSNTAIATVSQSGEVTGQAGGVVDITASSDGPEAAGASRVTVIDDTGYDVELRYVSGGTSSQEQAFTNAVARWEGHITGDISNLPIEFDLSICDDALPVMNEVVDDLLIFVFLEEIDGVGNILGQAGPCLIRTSNDLPVVGLMRFDTADLDFLETEGLLEPVILHEMAHVMGFGTIWEDRNLLAWNNPSLPCWFTGNNEPRFLGAEAVAAYNGMGGVGDTVPVEDTGGGGTQCSHWDDIDFDNELMTGYINPAVDGNPLSVLSIESFEDVGYAVDPSGADSYSLPGGAPATAAAVSRGRQLVNDVWRGPIHWIDPQGRVTPFKPGGR